MIIFLLFFVHSVWSVSLSHSVITFFAPVGSSEPPSKLAVAWAAMRTHYQRAQLLVYVNGPRSDNIESLRALCSAVGHCHLRHFTERDIFVRVPDDVYVNINGDVGFDELFAMYRNASAASRTELVSLLQPDCLVRGRIPSATVRACLDNKEAAACGHYNRVNSLEPHMQEALKEINPHGNLPSHFTFTCGILWKRTLAPIIFAQSMADAMKRNSCVYDDVCLSLSVAANNYTIAESGHVADKNQEFDSLAPIIHADKRHYNKEWGQLPIGMVPLYDKIRQQFLYE